LPYRPATKKRVIKESSIHKYSKRRGKPTLKPVHKQGRIEWAKLHMEFGQKCRNVIWSEEKKFNINGPDGMQCYWADLRKELEIFSKNVDGDGSVMVWVVFSWNGTKDIVFVGGGSIL
jgi:hypothetical protein